jgi:hypothetical protein
MYLIIHIINNLLSLLIFFLDIYRKNLTLLAGLGAMGTMRVILDDSKVSHLSYRIDQYHSIFQGI